MATSLLALLDDIATMTKLAAKKTAGVLGDDLALNAEQVTGVKPERELPVVWAVAKGSMVNKAILVPAALLISQFMPWAVIPLLMVGGLFLCYEGVEKIAEKFFHKEELKEEKVKLEKALTEENPEISLMDLEKEKIKGAVRTDFILSAEILVISLGAVANQSFSVRLGVLVAMSILITIFVYGLVAMIVKMDDVGIKLSEGDGIKKAAGEMLLWFAPIFMKFLSIAGTIAMFLVGGGILVHGIKAVEDWVKSVGSASGNVEFVGPVLSFVTPSLLVGLIGVMAGMVVVGVFQILKKFKS